MSLFSVDDWREGKLLNILPKSTGTIPIATGVLASVMTFKLRLLPRISSLLISTLPVHSSSFFPQIFPDFSAVLAVANTGSCVGPQNKIGHPAGCMFPC